MPPYPGDGFRVMLVESDLLTVAEEGPTVVNGMISVLGLMLMHPALANRRELVEQTNGSVRHVFRTDAPPRGVADAIDDFSRGLYRLGYLFGDGFHLVWRITPMGGAGADQTWCGKGLG